MKISVIPIAFIAMMIASYFTDSSHGAPLRFFGQNKNTNQNGEMMDGGSGQSVEKPSLFQRLSQKRADHRYKNALAETYRYEEGLNKKDAKWKAKENLRTQKLAQFLKNSHPNLSEEEARKMAQEQVREHMAQQKNRGGMFSRLRDRFSPGSKQEINSIEQGQIKIKDDDGKRNIGLPNYDSRDFTFAH